MPTDEQASAAGYTCPECGLATLSGQTCDHGQGSSAEEWGTKACLAVVPLHHQTPAKFRILIERFGQAERHAARKALEAPRALANAQAEDPAIWLLNPTASEAYILQALRALHAAVEKP